MFFLYQIILSILFLISPIIIIFRIIINKEHKKRFIEKFSRASKKRIKGKLIWFHAASVGEILSIIPLIKNYEKNTSIDQIMITTGTLSSSKVFEKFKFKKTIHQFYPIDHSYLTKKFLNYWKPNLAIFIDSEIWPSMFINLNNKKIPLILLNARITKKTFNRWMMLKKFSQKIFNKITVAFPQNLETKFFLNRLKVKKINHIGNLKFAENNYYYQDKISDNLKFQLKNKKIWIASSTHAQEEIFCAKTHIELKKNVKNLITIIIPRHVHRSKEIISKIKKLNLKVTSHSSNIQNLKDIDIYIVDTFGETKKFHKLGSAVFLGGSIIRRGGQNPLEAARYGAKILHGPNIDNFKDVYKILKLFNLSKKITTHKQLASSITFKKNKNIGIKIKKIGGIILKKTIKELDYLINNEFKKT
ncbi:3-deoxy-D-manno-octulosonic acid transferase [Candidatus Pelagibacter sp.]|nr:3-deoxy-D-manno-octulosonic acid transferase [Candidatus Pelagibacter sp.]